MLSVRPRRSRILVLLTCCRAATCTAILRRIILTPTRRRSLLSLAVLVDLHRPVHIVLLLVRGALIGRSVSVQCFLTLAVEDGATALVLSHTAQLIIQVATVDLAAIILVLAGVPYRASFIVQGCVAEVLFSKTRILMV